MYARWVLVSLALAFAICAAPIAAQAQKTIVDQSGREVSLADTSKIISIGGDITEILYAIGADSRIVAVDSTSQFPPRALKEKKDVGYLRALSTEGVLSINGTIIIASDKAGPPEVVKALKGTTVPYVEIKENYTPEGIAEKVRFVSRVAGLEPEGEKVATQIERDFQALADVRARIAKPLRALFVLNVANGRAMVGGSDTAADAVIKLAGATNAAAGVSGFKPLSDEALLELQPEAIVTMRRTQSGTHDADQLMAMKGMSATPAAVSKRLITMDGLYMLGFGPRAPAAALDLMRELYPEIAAQTQPGK